MSRKIKSWVSRNAFHILAFLIPFFVVVVAFICQGMWPFGDRGIAIIDSYHQYVPFLSELQYKWRHFDSLFYSWNGGLGMNFWAVIAYYLASPLNLLLLVFPKSMVMECFSLIVFIKIGLSGLSFSYFLKKRFHHEGIELTVFGCCYALSSFSIGYSWNIMWLDCIVLFPLVMLGIYRLCRNGRGWLYGISLALCIFINYYIAFMICIFSCIDFLMEIVCVRHVSMRKKICRSFKFAGYSLIAGGFGAVMLIPTASALMASQSAKSSFPSSIKFYRDFFELLCQHFTAIEPTDLSGNFNLYCGVAVLLLIPVYLANKRIRIKDKIFHIAVAAFLLISLNTNYLTYIWHGFHFPNDLPGRYSFIYIFMLLTMAYEGFRGLNRCPRWLPAVSAEIWMLVLAGCWWFDLADLESYTWVINCVAVWIYGLLLTCVLLWKNKKRKLKVLLLGIMLIEACGYGIFGLCHNGTVDRKDYYSDQKAVWTLKSEIEEREADNFYRVELEERRGRDDVTWHNIPGMSLFSSTVNAGVDHLAKRLGFFAVTNKYSYQGATPETDAFFNIKYLMSNQKSDTVRTFEWMSEADGKNLYINHCALGLGFMVSDNILNWDYEKTNPFDVINQMVMAATDSEEKPFRYFGIPDPSAEGCDLTTDTWADWSYTSTDNGEGEITYTYVSDKEQDFYFYFKAAHCVSVRVAYLENKKTYSDEDGHIVHVGQLSEGDEVTLTFKLDKDYSSGTIKLIAAEHSMDTFYNIFNTLSEQKWDIDRATSTKLHGSVDVQKAGMLFTSIPYDEGWHIRVDGQDTEPEKIGDAFIGISLSEGTHEIEISYCPKGFKSGLCITVVCGILLILTGFIEKKRCQDVYNRKKYKISGTEV